MPPLFVALTVPLLLLAFLLQDGHSRLVLWCFCWGVAAGLFANLIESPLLGATAMNLEAFSVQIAPPLEELLKISLLAALLVFGVVAARDERLVLYAVSSGIGFSVIENFFHLSSSMPDTELGATVFVLVRSLSTTIMHGLATGFLGLCIHLLYGGSLRGLRFRPVLVFHAYALSTMAHALFNLYVQAAAFGPTMAVVVSIAIYAFTWLVITESGLFGGTRAGATE
jgi:RsiW-degrading membrane proteinase PrsW (M82 family)